VKFSPFTGNIMAINELFRHYHVSTLVFLVCTSMFKFNKDTSIV